MNSEVVLFPFGDSESFYDDNVILTIANDIPKGAQIVADNPHGRPGIRSKGRYNHPDIPLLTKSGWQSIVLGTEMRQWATWDSTQDNDVRTLQSKLKTNEIWNRRIFGEWKLDWNERRMVRIIKNIETMPNEWFIAPQYGLFLPSGLQTLASGGCAYCIMTPKDVYGWQKSGIIIPEGGSTTINRIGDICYFIAGENITKQGGNEIKRGKVCQLKSASIIITALTKSHVILIHK